MSVLKLSCALQELATCHHDWNSFGDHMLPADQHLLSDGHVQRNFAPVTCCGSCEYLADCLNCAHLSALDVWTQEEGQGGEWGVGAPGGKILLLFIFRFISCSRQCTYMHTQTCAHTVRYITYNGVHHSDVFPNQLSINYAHTCTHSCSVVEHRTCD